jgi:hypothetical protein
MASKNEVRSGNEMILLGRAGAVASLGIYHFRLNKVEERQACLMFD